MNAPALNAADMPPRIARLPRDARGYPIPYVAYRAPDGTPNFRVQDGGRRAHCAGERLCGLCGDPLGYWIAFIGGEVEVADRMFDFPAMHRACAEYAFATCPYLARGESRDLGAIAAVIDPARSMVPRTLFIHGRVALFVTRSFTLRAPASDATAWRFHPAPSRDVQWRSVVEGVSAEDLAETAVRKEA